MVQTAKNPVNAWMEAIATLRRELVIARLVSLEPTVVKVRQHSRSASFKKQQRE